MTELAFKLVGGIGLFLLGMVLLTDGIKALAGAALRRWLIRFTGTPTLAFLSGTLVTVLIQSSSATTITVIGFVSAGLLTFPQAIGVVFGASLGTTGTSWLVSVLGLKVSVGFYALPLVGFGAFLKLLARGSWRSAGTALAGFGLIFIGIETMQVAMLGLAGVFDFAHLPSSGLWAHLLAMLIGIVLTVIMQSSSAAIATTLTALHAGAVNFEQATSLVIGAAVGTTITGVLAAIGGSVPAKRTALAHVTFNLVTGLIAVVLLPLFLSGIAVAQQRLGLQPGAMSLAAFHSMFIATGVALFLPFVNPFSRCIEKLLPDRGPKLTRHLDSTLLQNPAVALEASLRALRETAAETFLAIRGKLESGTSDATVPETNLLQALERLQEFWRVIPPIANNEPLWQSRIAQLHAMEHLSRLLSRPMLPGGSLENLNDQWLVSALDLTNKILALGAAGLRNSSAADPSSAADWPVRLSQLASELADLRRHKRPLILQKIANGKSAPSNALELLDTMRWLDRLGYHASRICHYLGPEIGGAISEIDPVEPASAPQH